MALKEYQTNTDCNFNQSDKHSRKPLNNSLLIGAFIQRELRLSFNDALHPHGNKRQPKQDDDEFK